MATAKATKKTKKAKKTIDATVVAQRKHRQSIRKLFANLDFDRVKSDGQEFKFEGRTGEIDDIYIYGNIMVLAEYTLTHDTTAHVAKKNILYDEIHKNQEAWVQFVRSTFVGANEKLGDTYLDGDYRVRICYFSRPGVSEEIENKLQHIFFLNGTTFRYFESLAKTIHKTARYEFFKYLGLEFKDIGPAVKSSSNKTETFSGFVLPAAFSSFPKNFKIVSFYADPNTLLTMSYVLRRDSWRDTEGMYQRVLQRGRMNQMRKYLTSEKRVFVNNIIVTLPDDTKLNKPSKPGENIDEKLLTNVEYVSVNVPFRSDVIGIVDGQHRVFCYYEGKDAYEPKIKPLRERQNLLVTGIIYPQSYTENEKRRFEARLFLEINDKQKRTGSELKQSIELVLNPTSPLAIAKAIVQGLNQKGALKGLLQTNFFDPPNLIKTSSIVGYGLRPLIKFDGNDSLFSKWHKADKEKLKEKADDDATQSLRDEYVEYCINAINRLLVAAKKNDLARWKLSDSKKDRLLSPTIINGYIVCLRLIIENGNSMSESHYEEKLKQVSHFPFKGFKSSGWRSLGEKLYEKFFQDS
jgi:DGQHR domain-containing protein